MNRQDSTSAFQSSLQRLVSDETTTKSYWLPSELWLEVCGHLSLSDVSSFSRTEYSKYRLLLDYLFGRDVKEHGTSCLPSLAQQGNIHQIRKLQGHAAFKADARDLNGNTALLLAIDRGHKDIAAALINTVGPHVNMRNGHRGCRPLTLAIRKGQTDVVQQLLTCENIQLNGGRYTDYGEPLFLACQGRHDEILRLLLACPALEARTTREHGETALHIAARKGNASTVEILLDDGRISPSAKDGSSRTALDYAFAVGAFDVIEVLYAHGIYLQTRHLKEAKNMIIFHSESFLNSDCYAIWECAASRGHLGLVRQYLPGAGRAERRNILRFAAASGHVEIVKLMLKHISPNFKDEDQRTPISYAREYGQRAVVDILEAHRQKRKRKTNDVGDGRSKKTPIIID